MRSNPATSVAVFRGLSDSLQCCIETGNPGEGNIVLKQAEEARLAGQLTQEQIGELYADFYQGFPDEFIR